MKASETRVDKFLSSADTIFTIPVYQRNYDWTIKHCKQLLKDIIKTASDTHDSTHFIGSIVYVHDDVYSVSGTTELSIIDGQQRLTTITLMYLAIYHLAQKTGDTQLRDKIYKTYLVNEFAPESDRYKLKSTENNKEAFQFIFNFTENTYKPLFADEVNIFDIEEFTNKKIEYAIFLGHRFEPKNTADFYVNIMQKLFELHPETFLNTELKEKLKIYTDESRYGNLNYYKLSDGYFILTNTSNTDKIEKLKQVLIMLGYEDELTIKYTE